MFNEKKNREKFPVEILWKNKTYITIIIIIREAGKCDPPVLH